MRTRRQARGARGTQPQCALGRTNHMRMLVRYRARARGPPGAVRGGHDAILEMLNLHDRSMERLGTGAEAGNASDAAAAGARASAAGPPPGRPRPAAGEPDEL
jgi:hypothetical protein